MPPRPLRSSAHTEGLGREHPFGPLLRCAALGPTSRAQAPRAAKTGPSEAMARVAVRLFGCPTPCWLRLRRGGCGVSMRVEALMPRGLARRSCLNGAATQRSEFCGAPRNRPGAGRPFATRRGRRLGVALSLVTFFRRRERKLLACRATPGLRPETKHAFPTSTPQLRQAQPERFRVTPRPRQAQAERAASRSNTTKTIATSAL